MVSKTEIKAYPRKDRGGWIIYLPKNLVEDSNYPLNPKEKIFAIIEKQRVIIRN